MSPPMLRRLPFFALVVVAASLSVHCSASPAPGAGGTPATGVVEASATASPEPSAAPIPMPTGPPITPALAKAQNFLLYLGGNLNTHAVTRIEGHDTDAAQPRAVMSGAPTDPALGVQAPELSPDR